MIEALILTDLVKRLDGAGLGVVAAINEPGDPRIDDRAGTHRARFQRDRKDAINQPPVADDLRRLTDGDDLGMGGGVLIGLPAIKTPANYFAGRFMEDYGPNRDFVHSPGVFRFGDRKFDQLFRGWHRTRLATGASRTQRHAQAGEENDALDVYAW